LLLYGVQCAVGFRVRRTPALHRTRVQRIALAVLGASIVLLAFYDTWLGFAAAGDGPFLWGILLVVSKTCPCFHLTRRKTLTVGASR
jgi:hypothetical protein